VAPDLPVRENRAHDSLPDYEILGLAALATFGLAFVRNAKSITDGRGDIDSDMIVAGALLKRCTSKGAEGSNPSLTVVFEQFHARLEQLIKRGHQFLGCEDCRKLAKQEEQITTFS
jgi:hypothetical protein